MLDGWWKDDLPTLKQLQLEVDLPEFLVAARMSPGDLELVKAVGNWTLIAFYYLLQIGGHTIKVSQWETKQTTQFCRGGVTFFCKVNIGSLKQLS